MCSKIIMHKLYSCTIYEPLKRAVPRNVPTIVQLCLFHMLARLCLKSVKLGFSNTWTENFQMYKLDLEKTEEPESKLPTSIGSLKKQESSRKTSTSALLTTPEPLTVWIATNCGRFWKRWEYQTTWPASWETYVQVRKQQLELDMEHQTGSKLGKEYVKAVYCHPAYLTFMQKRIMKNAGLD